MPLFIKFINMLVNDSHYLLDEILEKLPQVRQIELDMENRQQWMQQDPVTFHTFNS